MEELLVDDGHEIVAPEESQIALIVTCCVIESTERRMLKRIGELKKYDKRILVGGCMASIMKDKISAIDPEAEFVSPRDLGKVLDKVGRGEGVAQPARERKAALMTADAIVPIGQGCTEQCSYCVTRLARGSLKSYPEEDVVNIVSQRLMEGSREIRLTAQDSAAYGKDIDTTLPHLLRKLAALEGEFRIRVGMANITNLLPIISDTLEVFKTDKIYKFLHVPVQSGDDDILRKMRRRYRVKDFVVIYEKFRSHYPDSTISTDIITGFPGETENQFESSLGLMEEIQPEIINVTRFSAREGTEAFDMSNRIPGWKSKERSRKLSKLRTEISTRKNNSLIGSVLRVMTTEHVKRGTTVARTDSYRPVVLPKTLPLGAFHDVKIVSATDAYLKGELT